MKLQRLDMTARGRSATLAIAAPVVVLSGPNGAGKSSTFAALQFVLTGAVTVDGKARKQPGEVFAHMSKAGEPVGVHAIFDGGAVARVLTATATGASQSLSFSACPGAQRDAAQAAIVERIGDMTRVDVADLLSKGPTDRRAAILRMCRKFAKAWTLAELRETWEALVQMATGYDADGSGFAFELDTGAGLLASIEAHAAAAKATVLEAEKTGKRLQAAIDQWAHTAADASQSGDAVAMGQRIDALNAEIARLSSEVAAIDAGNRSAETIERRLTELAELPHPEKAQADALALHARQIALIDDRAAQAVERVHSPTPPAEIEELRRMVAEQQRIVDTAVADSDASERRVASMNLVLAHAGGDCPTCARPMDATAADALRRAIDGERRFQADACRRGDEAADTRACLHADLVDAEAEHSKRLAAFTDARLSRQAALGAIDADLASLSGQLRAANDTLARAQKAEAERAELHARRASLPTGDSEMIRAQIAGAAKERAELSVRRDAVLADGARVQSYRAHIVERDELAATLPALKASAEAWRELVNRVGESATAPFLDACNKALPSGWYVRFAIDGADFTVTRGDVEVPFSALSGGERTMAVAAMSVALAGTSGNPWRAIVIDDCERIMGDDWHDPAHPAGLFAAFVERLALACKGGLVDQVFLATSRRLDGDERAAIGGLGLVQVVEMGEPARCVPAGLAAALPIDDAKARERAIREALKGAGVDAMQYVHEVVTGARSRATAATLRRVVQYRACESGEPTARVVSLIEKAKAANPPKDRGTPDHFATDADTQDNPNT